VTTPRFILVLLICASPVILLRDGLIAQGIVAGIASFGMAITALTIRPGETGFLLPILRLPAAIAAIPILWIVVQVMPLRTFAHPIWKSATAALGHPLWSSISIDPGASIVSLGQYISLIAVALLSAAVAVNRQRAESILFALIGGTTCIAAAMLGHAWFFPAPGLDAFKGPQAIDCVAMGTIIAGAACIRTIERFETRQRRPDHSPLEQTLIVCCVALAMCWVALLLAPTRQLLFAVAYGFIAFAAIIVIRRLDLRILGIIGIAVPALAAALLLVAAQPVGRGTSVSIAFAASAPSALTAISERALDDAPVVGTGAGSFTAIAPIYREMNDPPVNAAATTAAVFAIELGQPMLWLIVALTAAAAIMLLRASLRRGRDSFYPAMGGSCLMMQLILGFINTGLLGSASELIMATVIGLSIAQSKSRTA
jgi:hypothetical protein